MSCTNNMHLVRQQGTVGRLKRAVCALMQMTVAYDRGYQCLVDEPASIAGKDYGKQPKGRGTKAGSSAPKGRDVALRAALIKTSLRLDEAIAALQEWEWPGQTPWRHPHGDQDPHDVRTPVLHPHALVEPIQQLRGFLSGLQTADWERSDPADKRIVLDACSRVDAAMGSLKAVGVWERPQFEQECGNCYAPKVYVDGRCEACYRYKKANKRERPQHLWVA